VHVIDDLTIEVLDAERRRVQRVRVSKRPRTSEAPLAAGQAGDDEQGAA
jgi:CBS domain containing-hemolysin-like protein